MDSEGDSDDEVATMEDLVEFLTKGSNLKIDNDLIRAPLLKLMEQLIDKDQAPSLDEKKEYDALVNYIKTTNNNLAEVYTQIIKPAFEKNKSPIRVTINGYSFQ